MRQPARPRVRRRVARASIAVAVNATLAVVTTWPLALDWRSRIPLGAERVATVPQFNLWTLRWNADRFEHLYRGYWNAPIFWPIDGAFARSEAQPLTGLVYTALRPFGGGTGAYNLTLWCLLVLNGLALSLLARRLGASFPAVLLAGALGQSLAFVFNELGVLQLVPLFPVWLLIERVVAYRQRPSTARLAGAGACLGALALVSGYYALFTLLAVVLAGPILLAGAARPAVLARDVTAALAVAVALAAPFSLAQRSATAGERWTDETVRSNSARAVDWLQHEDATVRVPWARARDGGTALFPGAFLLALAVVGVAAPGRHRRVAVASVAAALLLALVSLGTRLRWGDVAPYEFLRDHVAGFDRLRSPFRAAAITQAFVATLAALGLAWAWRRPAGRIIAVAFVVASLVETVHWDQPVVDVPDVAAFDWVRWLSRAPDGAVAMVPFPASGSVGDYEATTTAMLAGLEHDHPLVNGYTGLFPDSYRELRARMLTFPDPASVAGLREHGVRYVVLRQDDDRYAATIGRLPRFGFERAFEGEVRDVWVTATPQTRPPSSPPTTP
jgi:hypothetical protein